jgi:replicative DNA helicase
MNAAPRDIHKRKEDEFTEGERALHFGAAEAIQEVPCNIEAEQALLGTLMMNNEALDALRVPIEPQHFFEKTHREIFAAIIDLRRAGRSANPVTIRNHVEETMIGDMTIASYLARMMREAVNAVNAPDYAMAIVESAARRACISLSQKMEQTAYSKELDILDEFEALRAKFESVSRALSGEEKTKTLAQAARLALDGTANAYQGKGAAGVDYGMKPLMDMVGPFMPGQLIVIGGATKQGKSSLIEQLVAGAAINGHPVWVNSGEMKAEELAHRALSRLTDIQAWRQIRGKVSSAEYEMLENARRNAETWQERVFIRDDSMTLRQFDRDYEDFAKRHPGAMGVVDHIGLMERDSSSVRMSDAEFAPLVTRRIKLKAGDTKTPIVAASQLKKNTFEITDKRIDKKTYLAAISRRPKYGDLFGACEKDANHVIIPFRAEPILQEIEPAEHSDLHPIWEDVMKEVQNKAELVLALSRHTKWPQRKSVGWDGGKTMFTDLSQGSQGSFL